MKFVAAIWRANCVLQFACCLSLAGCAGGELTRTAAVNHNGLQADAAPTEAVGSGEASVSEGEPSKEVAPWQGTFEPAPEAPLLAEQATSDLPDGQLVETATTAPTATTESIAASIAAGSQPAGAMTFESALSLAEANNGSIADGQRAIQRADGRQQELEASYASDVLLRLVGNSDQGIDSTAFRGEEDRRAGNEEVGAELRWTPPWWHKRTVLMDAGMAGVDRKIAEVQSEEARLDLGLEIYRQYLAVLLQLARLKISSESLSAVETRYRATADSQVLGLASPLTALLDEANVSNQKAEVAANVSQLNDDLNSLYQLLGAPYDSAKLCGNYFAFSDYVGDVGDPHDAAMQQTRTIALEIDKHQLEKGQYEQLWLPRLSVSASYAHGFDQVGTQPDDVGSFGLELAIPLPNFEMARSQQQRSAAEVSYLQSRLTRTATESERRIRDMQAAIQTSKEKLRLRDEAVTKQRERITALRKGLEIGQITRAELEILEDAAKSTIIAYVDSLYGHLMRIAELNREYRKLPRVPETCEAIDVLSVGH
jgi:outer membrane protein TolC